MEVDKYENAVFVPSNTETVFCSSIQDEHASTVRAELNAFGLKTWKRTYRTKKRVLFNTIRSRWLLIKPSDNFRAVRDDQINTLLPLRSHAVTLAFGSLSSPYQFKCASRRFIFQTDKNSRCSIFFAKSNAFITINNDNARYKLRREHIDATRGAIIDVRSIPNSIVIHICLRSNLDEYEQRNGDYYYGYFRRLYLQNTRGESWQPSFSAMRLSIGNIQCNRNNIFQSLNNFIQFLYHHSIPIHFGSIELTPSCFIPARFPFNTTHTFVRQYACHMLNSIGCRMESFTNDIIRLSNRNTDDELFYFTLERLRRLALLPENYFLDVPRVLPSIVDHYHQFYLNSVYYQIDQTWTNYVRVPWFCLTPTRLITKPYKFMRSNRVFRFMSNARQSIAFVEFRDDTGSAFLSKELVSLLRHYLENGFHFGGRHYIYLHHAQSQIRNKQFYFYCEIEGGMTRKALEAWMGTFDRERISAKNTARRTQPFSSTEATIEIADHLVKTIPDIKTKDGKYNFTDGVGQISSQLNRLVHKSIGIDVDAGHYVSSVLQIRYGGCKGTLAVNPLLDGQKEQLLIRPSMNKFECQHRILELCKRSLRRHLCLNREVINLLSFRGISDACLRAYQLRNIIWLTSSLFSNDSPLDVIQDKVLNVFSWAKISSYSNLREDPFIRRLLQTTISNNLQQLVTRAHIRLEDARYMFGIVDEYKVLQEGQVFIQISGKDGNKTVLTGPVAITKNPCRHPGDLRVLEAVNKHELSHHCDVLVFPQQGSRPHANEISGSDLDGDEYTVIWDSDLVPTSPNPPPYEYDSGPPPKPLNRVVTRADRVEVILNICEQDNLGKLSNTHLVLVDQLGIDSEEAISLAAGLSQELDSVKSGQHPYSTENIENINSSMGRRRPDFMQAPGYDEYPSEKILGKLFRSARHLTDIFTKAFPIENTPIILDSTLLHHGYKKYIDSARKLYEKYRNEMLQIIGSYGFSNEIDLFCCAESHNMKANERSDIQYTVQKLLKAVFQDIRTTFYEEIEYNYENQTKAASTCYYVAYTDESEKDKCMLSFPWVLAGQLLRNHSAITEADMNNQSFEKDSLFSIDNLDRCLEDMDGDEHSVDQAELIVEQLFETAVYS